MQRKGQSGAMSAIFIIVVTALIVLYILFLPPSDRAALLGEGTGSSGGSSSSGSSGSTYQPSARTLLDENVGHVNYLGDNEREHSIPSFRISTSSSGSIIKEANSAYVRSSVFDFLPYNMTFSLDEALASDLKLSFNVGNVADGRLTVYVNGQRVIDEDYEAMSSHFITLPGEILDRHNEVTFAVSSPGWSFWTMNEYQLSNIRITGTLKDVSGSMSRQIFFLSEEELDNLDRAILKFYPDCVADQVGRLHVSVNGREVSSSVADCGVMNNIELDEGRLYAGENDIEFETDEGSYLFTSLEIKTILKEMDTPKYYFDMDDNYFTFNKDDDEATCGDIDGICPEDCEDDIDKDCCFEDRNNYWCDFDPSNTDDRCVAYVEASECDRCISGYENYRGYAPDACEELCGDDKDDECPSGCSATLDKDCCYEANEDNYWCDDLPIGKPTSSVCRAGVTEDERNACPSYYRNEDGRRLTYSDDEDYDDEDETLKSPYDVKMIIEFTNTDLHSADILVNGREIGLDTYSATWRKVISDYVRSGTNSIEIVPKKSMDIASLVVKIER